MKTPKKCLITGGCGFLGSNIASHYLGEGSEVIVIDALFRKGGSANLAWLQSLASEGQLQFVKGDLAEEDLVNRVFLEHGRFDYICHLAGQVAMTTSLSDPRRDLRTNLVGTFNVLEATRKYSPESLVAYSSTNKVYGDLEDLEYTESETRYQVPAFPDGFSEYLRLDFASPYGCSKGGADQYVRDWHRNYGVATVVFRHSSIYGGRQFSTFDQGWIGWFCQQALVQAEAHRAGRIAEKFTIAGSGKQVRDVLHAEDLVRLYAEAYNCKDQVAGQIFNIGGGIANSLSLLELFHMLRKLTGQPALSFEKLAPRASDQKVFVADITKAESILGWTPCIPAEEGIQRMLDWVGSNN
ncbi:SDR family NAD(P)-dependent oxidoreductase [Akkermansiaceae bacterium]|nr:SDR family NAD(P)-dependent oxidoreductase [Akkermansiaceae bacterium]